MHSQPVAYAPMANALLVVVRLGHIPPPPSRDLFGRSMLVPVPSKEQKRDEVVNVIREASALQTLLAAGCQQGKRVPGDCAEE